MGIKIKNLQTGEFEKFNIPALKGEKGEPGEIEPSEKVDYIGKQHSKLRDTMNANVDYIIKTAIGEFNYLDYEGQHITATNSIEGHAKSAILKGNTLVNLQPLGQWSIQLNKRTANLKIKPLEHMIKSNTKYILKLINKPSYVYAIYLEQCGQSALALSGDNTIVTTKDDINGLTQFIHIYSNEDMVEEDISKIKILLIEYQEGMENWDIPYFEGMQSVKMPVLTTTGKNLYNSSDTTMKTSWWIAVDDGVPNLRKENFSTNYSVIIPAKGNTKYTYSGNNMNRNFYSFLDKDYNVLHTSDIIQATITSPQDTAYVLFYLNNNDIEEVTDLQVEEGEFETSYEPYKTNILSTSEDVTLRGIGDVKDTLDLVTGELTQAVYEYTFTGDEGWEIRGGGTGGYTYFTFSSGQLPIKFNYKQDVNIPISCDKLPIITHSDFDGGLKKVGINLSYFFRLNFEDCNSNDGATVEDLRAYLKANPTTVQYPISKTIKTVDLSDNHVYSYKGTTHYDCSSAEGSLVPTLSVKVPTDTQLTIQEQKATTQTLLIKNMDLQQSIKEVQAMNLAFNTALYNSFNSIREEVEDIKKHVSTNENLEGSF